MPNPNTKYCVDAKTLVANIQKYLGETKSQPEFLNALLASLEPFVIAEAPVPMATFKLSVDPTLNVWTDSARKWVFHRESAQVGSVYAKISSDKIVPLEESDRALLAPNFRIYVDKKGRLLGKKEVAKLAGVAVKRSWGSDTDESSVGSESGDEGADDGNVIENPKPSSKAKSQQDSLSRVASESAEVMQPKVEITEEKFSKFIAAQTTVSSKTDSEAIARVSGLQSREVEEILLHYKYLADKYPQILTQLALASKSSASSAAAPTKSKHHEKKKSSKL